MRRRSILTAGLVAGALVAGTAACGTSTDKPTPAAEPEGTVTWWDTSDATNEAPKFKELITQFEASFGAAVDVSAPGASIAAGAVVEPYDTGAPRRSP